MAQRAVLKAVSNGLHHGWDRAKKSNPDAGARLVANVDDKRGSWKIQNRAGGNRASGGVTLGVWSALARSLIERRDNIKMTIADLEERLIQRPQHATAA